MYVHSVNNKIQGNYMNYTYNNTCIRLCYNTTVSNDDGRGNGQSIPDGSANQRSM